MGEAAKIHSTNGHSTHSGPVGLSGDADGVPFRALFESTPVQYIYCDPQLIVRYMNPAATTAVERLADALDLEGESLVGDSVETLHAFSAADRRALRAGKAVHAEATVGRETIRLDATPVWIGGKSHGIGITWDIVAESSDVDGALQAIDKVMAVIEFDLDGTIRNANGNFLATLGYSLDEIKGRHHRMFVEPEYAASQTYQQFWESLRGGAFQAGEYKRVGKGGKDVWIQASYNPVLDRQGKTIKVIKYATDVTAQKLRGADAQGQLSAIDKVMAVIEFDLDGTIRNANGNFLATLGYGLEEVKGRHHRMFVEPAYGAGSEYAQFWDNLRAGRFQSGEFKRFGKGGKEVWIQASYNPILDLNGKASKVVKFAIDVTAAVMLREEVKEGAAREREAQAALQGKVDSMLSVVNAASKGDLTRTVTVSGADTIGQMGEGLATFLADLRKSIGTIGVSAQSLGASSEELTAVSQSMATNAEQTSAQAGVVSAAAEQVNRNIQTVSASAEEMSASIREIAKSATDAARVAGSAVKVAETTNATIGKLGESSAEIGKVIKVITSIAQQTNLLALNATIEAARAGEAGKGFAVVANEVKELAKETAKATEDISQKIEAIQSDTRGAVAAIAQISSIIGQINDIQNTIASAVEEQTATTNEISRNVSEAAKGSGEIAENITGVAEAARHTTLGANDSRKAAAELTRMASDLQALVARFAH